MLPRQRYISLVRRPYPPLYTSLIMHGYREEKYFKGIVSKKYSMRNILKSDHNWYYSNPETGIGIKLTFYDWLDLKRLKKVDKIF